MKNVIYAAIAAVALLLVFFPTTVERIENTASEDAKYIRRVYGEHTVGQRIVTENTIHVLEIALRASQETQGEIKLFNKEGNVISIISAHVHETDTWVRFPLQPALLPGEHIFTLRAEGQSKDNPFLARYQVSSDIYPQGEMVVDGVASYGDMAFRGLERVPLWYTWVLVGAVTFSQVRTALYVLCVALLVALAVIKLTKFNIVWPLLLLGIVALSLRIPYIYQIDGVYGGDAFNYIIKAEALLHGEDPFAADPRKGPVWSLILLPGLFTPDPILWSRWLGVIASAATVVLVPLVGRRLGLPLPLAFLAGIALAINRDFIWEAPSGLANTLFALGTMASLLAYTYAQERRGQYLLAAIVAFSALTRYEGVLFAVILLPAAWWKYRLPWPAFVRMVVVAGAIMAIPLLSYVWSGVSGIRTPSDIADDGGLQLVRSVDDLTPNIQALAEFFGRCWILTRPVTHVFSAFFAGIFLGGILLVPAVSRVHNWLKKSWVAAVTVFTVIFILVIGTSGLAVEWLALLPAFLVGLGTTAILRKHPFDGAVVILVTVLQLVVITLILPKTRYFLHIIPILSILFIYGFYALVGLRKSFTYKIVVSASIGLLLGFIFLDSNRAVVGRVEWYNEKAQDVAVLMKGFKSLAHTDDMVAYRPGELAPIAYIPRSHRELFLQWNNDMDPNEEMQWLKEKNIRYIIDINHGERWKILDAKPEAVRPLHTYSAYVGDAKATVYVVDRTQL